MTTRILTGDCRDILKTLPDNSVHCCVTSPPYYGLRDYGTAQWDGGDAACDHIEPWAGVVRDAGRNRAVSGGTFHDSPVPKQITKQYAQECGKCGARRIDRQIGLEATPDAWLAEMVSVFREVRRVLRSDGTCWVNVGSSYSTGKGSNVTDQLNRLLEGGLVFFTNAGPRGVSGHGVGIALQNERTPNSELSGFLTPQRDGVEQRHQHLGKITDLFTSPGCRGFRLAGDQRDITEAADTEVRVDEFQHRPVVPAQLDAQSEAILAVLRPARAWTGEDDETTLAVHEADKPSIAGDVRWHSAWHTFARQALRKGLEDVYLVDQAVPLGDRPQTLAGLLCDFRVAKAGEKQITLASIHSGLTLTISDIRQLWFVLRCGSIVPYSRLYADASRSANALLPKQDLGMPWRLARALQEDGWILRSPIIWAKPNPMPESVTDRPTSSYEHVFLLTKSARYFYDADAVREEPTGRTDPIRSFGRGEYRQDDGDGYSLDAMKGRNLRNIWTIATEAFPDAHFATFPTELASRCIRAGTSERGCCAQCGEPWVRQTKRSVAFTSGSGKAGNKPNGKYAGSEQAESGDYDIRMGPSVSSVTTGWSPSCPCEARCQRMGCRSSGKPPLLVDRVCPKCGTRRVSPVPCTVLDPFSGAGTTALVASRLQRDCIGIELNPQYAAMARTRIERDAGMFAEIDALPVAADSADERMADLFALAAD